MEQEAINWFGDSSSLSCALVNFLIIWKQNSVLQPEEEMYQWDGE